MESKLPRSSPEAEGVGRGAIQAFIELAEREDFHTHSLVIVRHGRVIEETWWDPYRPEENHLLYSLTKSFTSTAMGFAISEGLLGLDDPVIDLLPEAAPDRPSPNLRKLKVRHLLSMSAGHLEEPCRSVTDGTWQSYATRFLAHPIPHEPGSHFLYSTPSSNLLSILIQKVSGQTLDQFLTGRLLNPLGIENATWTWGGDWVKGGTGLFTTTESVAKLGLLYLQGGEWNGEQLIPASWVTAATCVQVANGSDPENDWQQGYGFQFWRCRNRAFRGDGAFGQFCVVIPERDVVIAITSGASDMQKVLNGVWEILLPGFGNERDESKLESSAALASTKLRSSGPRNTALTHPEALELKCPNPAFTLSISGRKGALEMFGHVPLSLDEWTEFDYSFGQGETKRARSKAGWISSDLLEVAIWNPYSPQDHRFKISTKGWVEFQDRGSFESIPPQSFMCAVVSPESPDLD